MQFLVVAGALLTLFIALTPQGKAGFHTVLFLTQVLDTPVKPQAWFTDEPLRQEVRYPSPEGTSIAQVYRIPDGEPRASVVLALGVYDQGFDGHEVVNLGYALARAGYVVMYHWSPSMGLRYRIEPDELGNLVSAFVYLDGQDYSDSERVGIGGFCVGASFALIAASDDRIRHRVHFVNALGPYFDAELFLLQAASRSVEHGGLRKQWEPENLTIRVLANELIDTLEDSRDTKILSAAYDRDKPSRYLEKEGLSYQGIKVAELVEGVEPAYASELVSSLPKSFREDLARISPSAHISGVQARILVMHDRDDRLVPAEESRRLVEATRGRLNVRHTELLAFDHVVPTGGGILTIIRQAATLYRHMYEIIRIAH